MEDKSLEKERKFSDLLDFDRREAFSYWQRIFIQSKVNGCPYRGDDLPQQTWDWPKKTWLQNRLNCLRERQFYLESGAASSSALQN